MKGLKKTASVFLSLCMAFTPLSGLGFASASSNGEAVKNVILVADANADTAVEAPINV